MNTPSRRRMRAWAVLAAGAGALAFSIETLALAAATAAPAHPATPPAKSDASGKSGTATTPETPVLALFHQTIQPILAANCYECHADGVDKAGIAFDKLTTDDQLLHNPEMWLKVLKNTRAGLMPADGNPRLSAKDQATLDNWIECTAFGVDPKNPDPGRVTVHRLNRFEYQNTIHDLMGVDYDTDANFPADDIGYGFDNIADVLNVSSLLMEKYLGAAQTVVDQAVPTVNKVPATQSASGHLFIDPDTGKNGFDYVSPNKVIGMSFEESAKVSHTFAIGQDGDYKLKFEEGLVSDFTFTTLSCTVSFLVDGKPVLQKVQPWRGTNSNAEIYASFFDTIPLHLTAGDHVVTVSVEPKDEGVHSIIAFQIRKLTIEGPEDPAKWVHPPNYEKFFTRDEPPADAAGRRAYAKEILDRFATKAYRRPITDDTVEQLAAIAEKIYNEPGNTFEMGVSRAITAVLASPRFLFRMESPEITDSGKPAPFARIDEYSLASRLSYFLWSTMPDDELLTLAAAGQLRQNLAAQVQRMVADPRSDAFIKNFSGQWLQSRAVLNVPLSAPDIFLREGVTTTEAASGLTPNFRKALEEEAQTYFGYVMRNDRSINEFIDSNYMFLNSTLADYYYSGKFPIQGSEMRKIELAPDDYHGGVLTLGSVLMVTSNPTRTSPVKRGKWILENILDAPAAPPPPNIPSLDDEAGAVQGHTPTLREILAHHREDPLCASCHDRMDPLGLALENFNAFGTLRSVDQGSPVDTTGKLITGESFKDIRDLKKVLLANHREEFYRCLTEKVLTYALGRGVEYYDMPTVDKIVARLDANGGNFSALLGGVIDSAPFQEERVTSPVAAPASPKVAQNMR